MLISYKISILLLFCFLSLSIKSQYTLRVTVSNLKTTTGNIMLTVYNNEKGFLENFNSCIKKIVSPSSKHSIVIDSIPYGTYAIAIFQDVNDNKVLDKNFVGIPKEGFGFSNNPKLLFGPPNYKSCSFVFDKTKTEITIELKYY